MKIRIKKSVCVVFLGLLLIQLGCTKSETSKEEGIKIGFVLDTMKEERYVKDRDYFMQYAKEKGAKVEFASCDGKVSVQTSKVETLLSKGIDVLVLQPVNGEAAASIVKMALRDNVPVIAYDRIIKNAEIDFYVTQDSFRVGVLQAEAAVEVTKGKGNYVILVGEAGHSVAEAITRGNLSVLKKYPEIKIVVKQYHPGWSTQLALSTVENTLTRYKNNVQAILSNNDGMALGATQALEEQKLSGKVFVAGADADISAVRDIARGRLSMTVLKGIKPLAHAAVDVAIQLAKKQTPVFDKKVFNGKVEVAVVNTPVFKVVKDNIQTQIIDYGFHSASEIYGRE